jgi:hypothetical protein
MVSVGALYLPVQVPLSFIGLTGEESMLTRIGKLASTAIFVFLTACATHQGPTADTDEPPFLIVTDNETAVFQAAYDAMLDGRRESPVSDIDGPVRGYSLTRRWALDYWTSIIRVFPATGVTADGRQVSGYYPEVSGEGTLIIRGPSMDKRIYLSALERMALIGEKVPVSRLERGNYSFNRDQWRLHQAPSLRDGGTINVQGATVQTPRVRSVSERLKELDALKAEGKIKDSEYQQMRTKVLQDL